MSWIRVHGPAVLLLTLTLRTEATGAQEAAAPVALDKASEEQLVERIEKLATSLRGDLPLEARLPLNARQLREILVTVDELLRRYPQSSHRDKAIVSKLATLAELARGQPRYLEQLLSFTAEVAAANPQGWLASENAFYACQAFVLGARYEDMPRARRLRGMIERYEAFLEDHPASSRRPVIWASLIRNLIAAEQIERAQSQLSKLRAQYPDHAATHRAQGEVSRAIAVGKPFRFTLDTSEGETIRTNDYLGKVLVVHFWASWSDKAMEQLGELTRLHEAYSNRGLQLVGINTDEDRRHFERALEKSKLPWPQHFEPGGFKNEVLIQHGVISLPTYFVVDRRGLLRDTDPGDKLPELVKRLLAEAPPKPGS